MGEKWRVPKYVVVTITILLIAAIGVATEFAIENRRDHAITAEISRAETELQELGAQIAAIKDANLASLKDFVAA